MPDVRSWLMRVSQCKRYTSRVRMSSGWCWQLNPFRHKSLIGRLMSLVMERSYGLNRSVN